MNDKKLKKKHFYNRLLWLSVFLSALLLVGCYFFNNISYPFQLSTGNYSLIEFFCSNHRDNSIDDAVFVNVSYDKMIIPDTVEVCDTNRKRAITNRKLLLDFLYKVEDLNYRHLYIDLLLFDKEHSEYDSALVEQLLRMRNVAVAKHWDLDSNCSYPMLDNRLDEIAYYCDFYESKSNSGFYKYKYLQNDDNSIALGLYEYATQRNIKQYGPFFFDGCRLCYNTLFLAIHPSMEKEWRIDNDCRPKRNYWHMGPELLLDTLPYSWNAFVSDVSGKYIFVGDMKEDMHDTYAHAQPGAYLHYLGFKSLINGRHWVRLWLVILLFVVYTFIIFSILNGLKQEGSQWKPLIWMYKRPLIHFVCSLLGYSFILFLLSSILFIFNEKTINIFLPSLFFSLLSNTVKYNKIIEDQ